MFTLMFFDDWYLSRRENLLRHIGQPELVPESTFVDPYADVAWGYPSVFRDRQTGRWRCAYQGMPDANTFIPLLAESEDGIMWQLADLTEKLPIAHRQAPHQLFGRENFVEWSPCYVDPRAEGTDAWLKGLAIRHSDNPSGIEAVLFTSPDGINWNYAEASVWHRTVGDPITTAFWNPYRESYVFSGRPTHNDRRIAVFETKDWEHFSSPELALQADALDTPCAEIYGMPVFQYHQLFIGFLWIYHVSPVVNAEFKYLHGKVDCQLAYSYNGWHFQRALREPFIPNAKPGDYGAGCIYPSSMITNGTEPIRIYSSASKGEHASIKRGAQGNQSAILLHQLRYNGFVFLEPQGGVGELTTRPLHWQAGELSVNVCVPHGEARVQVTDLYGQAIEGYEFDRCIPFAGDNLAWQPHWQAGRTLTQLSDRVVRLEVRLTNGRLYSMSGEFEVKMRYEAIQLERRGR